MTKALEGRVCVVTGGSRGIGLAIARRFAQEGALVFVSARNAASLDEAAALIGPQARTVVADAAVTGDLERLMEAVRAEAGRIDVLVANAGGGEVARLGDITEQNFDETFALNVKGVVFTVQAALPLLSEGASVILIGSSGSVKALPSQSLYGASKAALRSLARSWTVELKRRRIRVNVLSPGPVVTDSLMSMAPPGQEAVFLENLARMIPLGRVGEPDDIGEAALFLASDASRFVAGTEMFVDGGHAQV
ncbi:MAG: 3-oxoacyl-ACP reductase [Caulobacter sp.]|nr:3-oxoacyl-ACP reductase [Caulobacter sp.]